MVDATHTIEIHVKITDPETIYIQAIRKATEIYTVSGELGDVISQFHNSDGSLDIQMCLWMLFCGHNPDGLDISDCGTSEYSKE